MIAPSSRLQPTFQPMIAPAATMIKEPSKPMVYLSESWPPIFTKGKLKTLGIQPMASRAIAITTPSAPEPNNARAWREASCAAMGWRIETPLYGSDTRELAHAMIAGGLRARLCCVDLEQLDAGFAGRAFDDTLLADLPPGCDPCGENGEFHTLVLDGPMFDGAVAVRAGEQVLRDGRFLYTDFLPA